MPRENNLRAVYHAVHDMRIGYPVMVGDALAWSVEYPDAAQTAEWLVISGVRAWRLGLIQKQAQEAYALPFSEVCGHIAALTDPLVTQTLPQIRRCALRPASFEESAALQLAKLGALLPAVLVGKADPSRVFLTQVQAPAVAEYRLDMMGDVRKVSQAHVPLEIAENAKIVAFRPAYGEVEHLAIVIGEPQEQAAPLVRLHSSCVTGDILGSLRCDCGDQFKEALKRIAEEGSGVVLYLSQEGRGIGIANKLRAYQLQDAGLDTVDANQELGFESDEREFIAARNMLKQLGICAIRLLSNNPQKVTDLQKYGIVVQERVAHSIPANPHNQRYLDTKAQRCGHVF